MEQLKKKIAAAIAFQVKELKEQDIASMLEMPPDTSLGDIAFPCFRLSALYKKSPKDIAEDLRQKIALPKEVKRAQTVGGYLNFFADKAALGQKTIEEILEKKEKFGCSSEGKGKTVVVEFSQPNTNKPMHLGHLRNNSLGEAVAELLKSQGFKAVKVNLINNRGIHICKSMLAYKKFGQGSTPEKEKLKPDHFVGKYYVLFNEKLKQFPQLEEEAHEMLRKWEQADKETLALWKKMNSWCIEGFKQTYNETGVEFDREYLESDLYEKGKEIILKAFNKGILSKKDDGAIFADLEKFGLPEKVILRSDGTSLYTTQDIYLALKKFQDYKFEKSIYVVASEQDLYFRQLFKILELLAYPWAKKLQHLSYGMVNLTTGKMKSREGTVVDADDLVAELKELARKEILKRKPSLKEKELEEKAKAIALAALKFYLIKVDKSKDILFNPEASISFEGETGPYLQYSYARAKSILRKAKTAAKKFDSSKLVEPKEKELVTELSAYPQTLKDSINSLSLHKLAQQLLKIAELFNSFYQELPVLKAEPELKEARLALVKATAQVLKNGLQLMRIEALEEM